MAITLGSIVVELLANTGGFTSGLSKASYEAKKQAKEIQNAFHEMGGKLSESFGEVIGQFGPLGQAFGQLSGTINEVGGALAGGGSAIAGCAVALGALGAAAIGGAIALGELAKGGAEIVERFSLISQKTGISTHDLQVFEAAGKTVGLSLEDMVIGMRKFDSALAGVGKNAAAGTILKELGVTAKTNKEALLQTADAFKAMEDGPEKAALAVQLFGKAGLNMIPFLNKGAEGMKEFNDLVDKFGPKIGKEAVEANEKYKLSTVQLDLEWQHFKVTIEQGVLPVLTKLNSIDWGEKWAAFKGGFSGPLGSFKAVADLQAQRAAAADEAHKEADAEEAKRSTLEKQVALQEEAFSKLKAGGSAAYALEQAREKMTAEIAVHHFDAATTIFNSLPGLQKAADLEALRVENAKRLAASYKSIMEELASGNFSRPNVPSKPLDPSQSKGLEAVFGKQPGKDPLEGAPDLGKPSFLTQAGQIPELGKMLNVGKSYLDTFYSHWNAQAKGTADAINADYDAQLAKLQGYLALGEISEEQAKDVYLKIQQERFDGLKRLREQNGTSTFKDAWTDMFAQIQASGKDFARSITQDIGSAIEGLNQQLTQFVVTGKGLNLKQIGQSLEANLFTSVLKKGESSLFGSLGKMFGLGDGSKPDGSSQNNALWVQFAGAAGAGGVGNLPLPNLGGFLNLGGGESQSGSGIFGGLGSLTSSIGGGIGSVFSSIGSLFGGFLAGGGDVQPGRAYIVGEKQPELFVPRSAGSIVPSIKSSDGHVQHITNTFNISTPDADSFKRSQAQISSAMGAAAQRGFQRNGR